MKHRKHRPRTLHVMPPGLVGIGPARRGLLYAQMRAIRQEESALANRRRLDTPEVSRERRA